VPRPAARIELNGKDVTAKWSAYLESLTVTDEAGVKSDTCEACFDNSQGFSAPPIGAELRVWIGYEPAPTYMGRYRIDSWTKEGPTRKLSVSAKAADMTSAIREPKMRSFHEKTVKEIVEQVAGDHGLTAVVDATIGARQVEHIDQQTESDMAFLTRLAKRQGATFKLADGKAIFAAKGSRKAPSGKAKAEITLTYGPTITSWRASAGERGNFGSASCYYIDPVSHRRRAAHVGKGKLLHRDRRLYGSKAEAEAAAEANLGDLTRGKVSVTVEMPGDPTMFAEALVTLKDFDPDVDGPYLAKSVTHTFSCSGYTTSLSLETEGSGTETDPDE
jgi:phage protein D